MLVLIVPTHGGIAEAELTWVACFAPRWFTRHKAVTHLGTNLVWCRVTTSIKITCYHSCRRLSSASTAEFLVPTMQHSTIGDRALAVAGPCAWNDLPVDLHLSRTFSTCKTHLKTHLFNVSFPSVWLSLTFLYRVVEAASAAYASLNLSLLHYVTLHYTKANCHHRLTVLCRCWKRWNVAANLVVWSRVISCCHQPVLIKSSSSPTLC